MFTEENIATETPAAPPGMDFLADAQFKPQPTAESLFVPPAADALVVETPVENKQLETVAATEKAPIVDSNKDNDAQQPVITADILNGYLSDATKGAVPSIDHVMQLTEQNERLMEDIRELQENPTSLFRNAQEQKIFEFLKSYQGDDYAQGLQSFANIQKLDIANMSAEDALREDYIMNSAKYGIPRNEAEQMFQQEYDEKYASRGELAKNYVQIDGAEAKKRLEAAKAEFTTPKVDERQAQDEQRMHQVRENYVKSVQNTMDGFKSLSLEGLTDNPEDDFTYEVENTQAVSEALNDYQGFFNGRYVTPEGAINAERLKTDISSLINQEQMFKRLFDHGINRGKEMEIAKRNNIGLKTDKPASNIAEQGSVPQNLMAALMNGTINK